MENPQSNCVTADIAMSAWWGSSARMELGMKFVWGESGASTSGLYILACKSPDLVYLKGIIL